MIIVKVRLDIFRLIGTLTSSSCLPLSNSNKFDCARLIGTFNNIMKDFTKPWEKGTYAG